MLFQIISFCIILYFFFYFIFLNFILIFLTLFDRCDRTVIIGIGKKIIIIVLFLVFKSVLFRFFRLEILDFILRQLANFIQRLFQKSLLAFTLNTTALPIVLIAPFVIQIFFRIIRNIRLFLKVVFSEIDAKKLICLIYYPLSSVQLNWALNFYQLLVILFTMIYL